MMNYEFRYFGPFVCKFIAYEDLYNFLTSCVNKEEQYGEHNRFKHAIIPIEKEYNLLEEDQKIFNDKFLPYINQYIELFSSVWAANPYIHKKLENKRPKINTWINYQTSNDFRIPHHHGSCDLSFIIYYSVPQALREEIREVPPGSTLPGSITFQAEIFNGDTPLFPHNMNWTHMPADGEIFIFPGYLQHYVSPFKSTGTRISVAGNVKFI